MLSLSLRLVRCYSTALFLPLHQRTQTNLSSRFHRSFHKISATTKITAEAQHQPNMEGKEGDSSHINSSPNVEKMRVLLSSDSKDGWDKCWEEGLTPWDLGGPTPVILHLLQTESLPKGRVLVPGCGSGILSDVLLDGQILYGWKMFPLSFSNLNKLLKMNPIVQVADSRVPKKLRNYSQVVSKEPVFYEGHFVIDKIGKVKDTFISFSGWGKGVAFVNNFNIGRFWPLVGPQCTLYVPAPLLRHGKNVVVILETEAAKPDLVINSVDRSDFTCGSKVNHVHTL